MVASFDDVERGGRVERPEGRSQFLGRAEGVATALDDEHRPAYRRQVRIAPFVWLPRWMQRVPKQDETGNWKLGLPGRQLRGHSPAHRLSTDEQGGAQDSAVQFPSIEASFSGWFFVTEIAIWAPKTTTCRIASTVNTLMAVEKFLLANSW